MTRQGFNLETIIVEGVVTIAELICLGLFVASAWVWIAILATR